MPHHKSCKKRLKTAAKANTRNKAHRSEIRTGLKAIRTAKSKDEALKLLPDVFQLLDKAAAKGRAGFSHNRASNYKSKISATVAKLA